MSSISAISGASPLTAADAQNDPYTLFRQLVQSINNGNLPAAQQAYSSLSKVGQGALSNSPLGQDMNAIGQALNSGDVSSAQQALATLQADAQKLGQGHHHHHHHKAQSASSSTSTPTDPTSPLGNNLNVTA